MSISFKVEGGVDIPATMRMIDNDTFWRFAAKEWWRLLQPFTPFDTGALMESVDIEPKQIRYRQPYAARLYYGSDIDFKRSIAKGHFGAASHWDAAAKPTETDKLIQSLQNYISSGHLK